MHSQVLPPSLLNAQEKCDCNKTFKRIKESLKKNDAGFTYSLEQ